MCKSFNNLRYIKINHDIYNCIALDLILMEYSTEALDLNCYLKILATTLNLLGCQDFGYLLILNELKYILFLENLNDLPIPQLGGGTNFCTRH